MSLQLNPLSTSPTWCSNFSSTCRRGRVVVLPWDKHIATGPEIDYALLGNQFRGRILELAATLSDDFGAAPG